MAYNSYINSFPTSGDFETYIESSAAKAPNVAYLKDTDKVVYTTILPNDYVVYGTTTGTTDFVSCGINFHVLDGIMYVAASDVPQSLTNLNNCFNSTEGRKITKIKKWAIDTSNVNSIRYMFSNCSNLTSLDLSTFDTANVTSIEEIFYGCGNLTSLDLSTFDTTKVTNMNYMFFNCSQLNKLYLSSSFFNSTSVTSYPLELSAWTDAASLEQFVQAAENSNGSGKTLKLSTNTKNALTQAQKDRITAVGWTIS